MLTIPEGEVQLGTTFDSIKFGWDNEFTTNTQVYYIDYHMINVIKPFLVPEFKIQQTPVSHYEYLQFIEAKGYNFRELWEDSGFIFSNLLLILFRLGMERKVQCQMSSELDLFQ